MRPWKACGVNSNLSSLVSPSLVTFSSGVAFSKSTKLALTAP